MGTTKKIAKKSTKVTKKKKRLKSLGWRECLELPDLGVNHIKAKVDTGARTSALHAENIKYYTEGGRKMVSFKVHPKQKSKKEVIYCHARLKEIREVVSSTGFVTKRPVIRTAIKIGETKWRMELTLINRDEMGFRMLLGREAMRGRFLVDPGKSYVYGPGRVKSYKAKVKKKKKKKND